MVKKLFGKLGKAIMSGVIALGSAVGSASAQEVQMKAVAKPAQEVESTEIAEARKTLADYLRKSSPLTEAVISAQNVLIKHGMPIPIKPNRAKRRANARANQINTRGFYKGTGIPADNRRAVVGRSVQTNWNKFLDWKPHPLLAQYFQKSA